ncbi:MAG: tRNA (guanosine(46)-N7)-methyltransferase TrmB [Sedimentisphaerales bacterium]|jgi:tRNA (guanine-N7-)-methyltransferase
MSRKLNNYPQFVLEHPNPPVKLNFGDIFGRLAPVHIEIGSGKGTFLVNQAKSQPDADFIGIEWAGKFYRFAVDRIGRWNLANVRIIRTDAVPYIAECVPDSSVDYFHIYYPDPWPKKRHNKRRFINSANTDQLIRCLKPAGSIRVATDFAEYFEQMKSVFASKAGQLEQIDFLPNAGVQIGEWVGSNFERKYLMEKRPIYTIAVRKK